VQKGLLSGTERGGTRWKLRKRSYPKGIRQAWSNNVCTFIYNLQILWNIVKCLRQACIFLISIKLGACITNNYVTNTGNLW